MNLYFILNVMLGIVLYKLVINGSICALKKLLKHLYIQLYLDGKMSSSEALREIDKVEE